METNNQVTNKNKNKELGKEILRFVIVGIIATAVDFGVSSLIGFLIGNSFTTFWKNFCTIGAGFIVSVIINYILSAIWVYKDVDENVNPKSIKTIAIFVLFALVGLFIGIGIWSLCDLFARNCLGIENINNWIGLIGKEGFWNCFIWFCVFFVIKTLLVMAFNYITRKIFIFKPKKN